MLILGSGTLIQGSGTLFDSLVWTCTLPIRALRRRSRLGAGQSHATAAEAAGTSLSVATNATEWTQVSVEETL
jgi:hypothetical protein